MYSNNSVRASALVAKNSPRESSFFRLAKTLSIGALSQQLQSPVWDDLPTARRLELLRLLGRMLGERLGRDDTRGKEAAHDRS